MSFDLPRVLYVAASLVVSPFGHEIIAQPTPKPGCTPSLPPLPPSPPAPGNPRASTPNEGVRVDSLASQLDGAYKKFPTRAIDIVRQSLSAGGATELNCPAPPPLPPLPKPPGNPPAQVPDIVRPPQPSPTIEEAARRLIEKHPEIRDSLKARLPSKPPFR